MSRTARFAQLVTDVYDAQRLDPIELEAVAQGQYRFLVVAIYRDYPYDRASGSSADIALRGFDTQDGARASIVTEAGIWGSAIDEILESAVILDLDEGTTTEADDEAGAVSGTRPSASADYGPPLVATSDPIVVPVPATNAEDESDDEPSVSDLDYFCWRERVNGRLLVPCADPRVYEQPFDFIFSSAQDAIDFLVEIESQEYDPDTWVLVHYTGTVVPAVVPAIAEL